jgi:hypothetical protein
MHFDEKNSNTKWQDSIALELQKINGYEAFNDVGHHTKAKIPNGYKKIRVHFVFDVKHDGRCKARLVVDGHLTEVPLESVYYGVFSRQGFSLVLLLAELINLELWAIDIGNAYLEAFTSELVYIIAGTRRLKAMSFSLARHCMVYAAVVQDGMIGLLTVFLSLVSSHARRNLIFGCASLMTCTSTFLYMLMT